MKTLDLQCNRVFKTIKLGETNTLNIHNIKTKPPTSQTQIVYTAVPTDSRIT